MDPIAKSYQKVKTLAKADSSDHLGNVFKGTTQGAVTGAVIGLMFGYYKKWNLFGSAVAGLLIGGASSNFLIKFKNKES